LPLTPPVFAVSLVANILVLYVEGLGAPVG
jgi:hypothetical protein